MSSESQHRAVLNKKKIFGRVLLGLQIVSLLVITFCEMSSLRIRQESSAKQSISPEGQRLQREQVDEAVSCVTNTE